MTTTWLGVKAVPTFVSPRDDTGLSVADLPLASAVLDLRGVVVSWNARAEALFGWSAAEAVGSSIQELIGWADVEAISALLEAGQTASPVAELRNRHGAMHRAQLNFGGLSNELHELTALLLVATDLTSKDIESEALRSNHRLLMETRRIAQVGSWDWDVVSDVVTRSAEQYDIWGLDPNTAAPCRSFEGVHEDDRAFVKSVVQASLDTGAPMNCVARIRRPDGEIRWIESIGAPSMVGGNVVRMVGTSQDVTSRELDQEGRRASDASYKMIVETAREGIGLVDANAVITFANERLADMLGRSVDELLGMPVMALVSEEAQGIAADGFAGLAAGRPTRLDFHFERPDGTAIWALLSGAPIFNDGRYSGALAMLTDITERHQAEADLHDSRERLAEAQKLALLGSWVLDVSSGAVTCSDQLYELIGIEPDDVVPGLDLILELVHPDDRGRCERFFQRARAGTGPIREELQLTTRQGRDLWVALRAASVPGPAGQVIQTHGTLQDISERKAAVAQLAHLALHDKLTGLANRTLFGDRLNHALARRRGAVTVLLIDLDGFKSVNEHLGHAAGDALLVAAAGRLSSALRPSDTIARFGGDEFAVLLEDAQHDGAVEAGDRLLESLRPPVQLDGRSLTVQASIGIAVASASTETADELLRMADGAMYAAKSKGGARCEVSTPQMQVAGAERTALESDLRTVGLGSEMTLHYQPLVDLRDGRLSGFEALMRWNHPERGSIGPDQFIPIAEASGVIVPIGRWVLNEACRQLRLWQHAHPSSTPLTMNVNVSARQLADAHLVDDVARALEINSLDPGHLTLEITETMILSDEDDVGKRLRELKALGVRISVDDFGTGYSSIGHLERFPVDEVKIDRSFVASLGREGQHSGVALGVLRLAGTLRLDVVAEGIEHVEQLAALRRAACTTGQGYYFAKPTDPAAIDALLRETSHYPMPQSARVVLVVDDEEMMRLTTARILRRAGFDVVEAGTGADAIRIAQEGRLDAAILDVGLPDMTGFEIAERLGEMFEGELPLLILSGTAVDVDDRVRGLNLGAEAYLTKPVAPQELIAVLEASLRSHQDASSPFAHRQGTRAAVSPRTTSDSPVSGTLPVA